MKRLEYSIDIDAKRDKVFKVMLAPDTYREWTQVAWPGSTFKGNWKQGEDLRFAGEDGTGGGTLANVEELREPEYLRLKHVGVILNDGSIDRDSDIAKDWIGATEEYTYTDKNGKTLLKVVLNVNPAWADEFDKGWPLALAKLKEICEKTTAKIEY